MKIVESFLTNNPCYKAGEHMTVQGLMLHSVGCACQDASCFIRSWNHEGYGRACVHAFIDGHDGTVYQTLPWDMRGWHCSAGAHGSGNDTHVGIEMCEPSCLVYSSPLTFSCTDIDLARQVVMRTCAAAVDLFAMLCLQYRLDPLEDGVVISHSEGYRRGLASNSTDPEHLIAGLGLKYTMDDFRSSVDGRVRSLRPQAFIDLVGPLASADMRRTGILASITLAQASLESGYGASGLARHANNLFGMKGDLSEGSWESAWDRDNVFEMSTLERDAEGREHSEVVSFRGYEDISDSIEDHSRYLLHAMAGGTRRYRGLSGCRDYRTAARIIEDGSYATDTDYADKLCSIIERWHLTAFDAL